MPVFSLKELSKLDWVIAFIMLAFLYVTFVEGDIILTGNRSFLYYKGFFDDFYKASYEQSGGFYANYLPSTFLAFAIWNLPLYLMGRIPEAILSNSFINIMWYKLLPVLLYFATSILIYKIAMIIGFEEKKSRLCQFAFIVCPIGVYSQFIFSQYDIFMVFFMVLGLYYYYKDKDNMIKFALFFGIAATFKYQALAYFAVFLVLREKRFRQLILYVVLGLLPLAVAIVPNLNSPYFYRCVFGFNALGFLEGGFEIGFISGISLILAFGAYLMFWAYTRRITAREEFISWSLYLATGVSFTVFGFSRWNPQWFIVMVPFLILSIFLNRHGKVHMLVMNIFIIALYVFSVNQWPGITDQIMLKQGVFKFLIGSRPFATTMADVYGYNAMVNLATCLFIIILIFFVFNHPKYLSLRHTEILPYMINYIRVAFLVGFFAFVIPAGICTVHAMRGDMIFRDNTDMEAAECYTVNITNEETIKQTFEADGNYLTSFSIRLGMHNRINDAKIYVKIRSVADDEVIYENEVSTLRMAKEEHMYEIVEGKIPVEPGEMYQLELTGSDGDHNCVATYYYDVDTGVDELAEIPDENGDVQIIMRIRGMQTE